jgi:hypothetical protein
MAGRGEPFDLTQGKSSLGQGGVKVKQAGLEETGGAILAHEVGDGAIYPGLAQRPGGEERKLPSFPLLQLAQRYLQRGDPALVIKTG